MRPLQPVSPGPRIALGIAFFVLFVAAWALATLGGFVSPTFLADPLTMLRDGWDAADPLRLRLRHRHDDLARGRRLRARGPRRRAARHPDGRLQAGRGVPRALRLLRPLPAGLGLHPAADPLGRHRRDRRSCSSSSSARCSRSCSWSRSRSAQTRRDLVEAAYTLGASTAAASSAAC